MRKIVVVLACVVLAGCVSTEMRGFVGRSEADLLVSYGQPLNIIEMPDGRRGYQYMVGGGSAVVPGSSTTRTQVYGRTATTNSTYTPPREVSSDGCLVTYFVRDGRVVGYAYPRRLVC